MSRSLDGRETVLEQERLIALATNRIYDAMDAEDIDKAELARRIGKSRSHVTQVLDGDRNFTLKTLALFGLACGVRWDVSSRACSAWRAEAPDSETPEPIAAGAAFGEGDTTPIDAPTYGLAA